MSKKRKRKPKPKSDVEVFLAKEEDIPEVTDLTVRGFSYDVFAKLGGVDRESLAPVVDQMVRAGSIIIAKKNGKTVGSCGFVVFPLVYNQATKIIQTIGWYVDEEHRNNGVGAKMLDEAQRIGREIGANHLLVTCRWDEQQAARLCIDKGFRLADSHYMKGL